MSNNLIRKTQWVDNTSYGDWPQKYVQVSANGESSRKLLSNSQWLSDLGVQPIAPLTRGIEELFVFKQPYTIPGAMAAGGYPRHSPIQFNAGAFIKGVVEPPMKRFGPPNMQGYVLRILVPAQLAAVTKNGKALGKQGVMMEYIPLQYLQKPPAAALMK